MLSVKRLVQQYDSKNPNSRAVDDVSFEVKEGEFFTLLGPSGCGKSTTLRCVAGLETPREGRIRVDGRPLFDSTSARYVPTHKRDIAMVFQSYAVWPHMTVFQNVAFPLTVNRMPKQEVRKQVLEALEMVGLGHLQGRSATLLSGGQQQRIALARAIVKGAKVLLLDEPLSNLDAELRLAMRYELRELQQRLGITSVYVTHDQEEALSLSDRIALMRNGKLAEIGTPEELYFQPKDPFTARFIGQTDLVAGTIVERDNDRVLLETPFGGRILGTATSDKAFTTRGISLLMRPEHIDIQLSSDARETPGTSDNVLHGRIVSTQFSGKLQECVVLVGQTRIRVQSLSRRIYHVDDEVTLSIPVERAMVVPETEASPVDDEDPAGNDVVGEPIALSAH